MDKSRAWDQQRHTTIYKINNKAALYSTGNHTQYPAITHNGKEYMYIYRYVYMYN